MDKRSPRDGRVIEELGTYDPMCPETDARVTLKSERIDYWLSVGAQPSDKVATLIKKYGTNGSHLEAQKEALERLSKRKDYTPAPAPAKPAKKEKEEAKAEADSEPEESGEETAAEPAAEAQNQLVGLIGLLLLAAGTATEAGLAVKNVRAQLN